MNPALKQKIAYSPADAKYPGLVGFFGMGESGYRRNVITPYDTPKFAGAEMTNTAVADKLVSAAGGPVGRNFTQFSDTDQSYLQIPNISPYNVAQPGRDFTVMMLVRLPSVAAFQFMSNQFIVAGNQRSWYQAYNFGPNRFRFAMSPDGTTMFTVDDNVLGAPAANTWYAVWGGWNAGRIWVATNAGAETASTTGVAAGPFKSSAEVRLGYRDSNTFLGDVAQFMIFDRYVPQSERTTLYNGGTFLDPTPVTNNPKLLWDTDFRYQNVLDDLETFPATAASAEQLSGSASTSPSDAYKSRGRYSRKMTITGNSGARLFRLVESSYTDAIYRAKIFIPKFYLANGASQSNNVVQFKSFSVTSDPWWGLLIRNRGGSGAMYIALYNFRTPANFDQVIVDLPIGKEVELAVRYIQASGATGRVQVWQDGVQIFDQNNVATVYAGAAGQAQWSVNNYSDGFTPDPSDIYVGYMSVELP